jgi:di/tripeptidase
MANSGIYGIAGPVIGFIAHMDTRHEAPSENINLCAPVYDGKEILLNREKGIVLSLRIPRACRYKGQTIITMRQHPAGADDKAGIAAIGQPSNTSLLTMC